jgi:hypothetical protein
MSYQERRQMYEAGLYWILREHGGPNGGWPPRDVSKVAGWACIRLLAHLTGRSPREVASDVIDHSIALEEESHGQF